MAPKKAAAATATSDASDAAQPFKWEGANDFKLLLLIQGRHALPDEYEQLVTAFPGVSTGGIRNRISNLRVKQRELYDSLGWTLPEGVAANAGKRGPKKASKRGVDESSAAEESPKKKQVVRKRSSAQEAEGAGEEETPKKARGRKGKKEKEEDVVVKEESSGAEAEAETEENVKAADAEEEEV